MSQSLSPTRPAWLMLACSTAGGFLVSGMCVRRLWHTQAELTELFARIRILQTASSPMLYAVREHMQRVVTETYTAASVLRDDSTGTGPLDALLPLLDQQCADHQRFVNTLEGLVTQLAVNPTSVFPLSRNGHILAGVHCWTALSVCFRLLSLRKKSF